MKAPLLAALAALTLAAPALSATPAVRVAYADLDLTAPADAQAMLQRIRKAARQVCENGETTHEAVLRYDACRREAVARAVAALNAPAVKAAFDGRPAPHGLAALR